MLEQQQATLSDRQFCRWHRNCVCEGPCSSDRVTDVRSISTSADSAAVAARTSLPNVAIS